MGLFGKKKKEVDFSDLSALGLDEDDFGSKSTNKFDSDPIQPQTPSFQEQPITSMDDSSFDESQPFQNPLPGQEQEHPSFQQTRETTAPRSFNQLSQEQQRQPPQFQNQINSGFDHKDFEILNAKLDSIKAMLESLNQRIERAAQNDQKYKW